MIDTETKSVPLSRAAIVAEAMSWRGTPYRHQASLKGAGTDCLGLIRGVWRAFYGPEPEGLPAYTPDWAEATGEEALLAAARRRLCERPISAMAPGDVLVFRMALGAPAKHAGVLVSPPAEGRGSIVHAYWGREVVESRLVEWWSRRIAGVFAFPDVED